MSAAACHSQEQDPCLWATIGSLTPHYRRLTWEIHNNDAQATHPCSTGSAHSRTPGHQDGVNASSQQQPGQTGPPHCASQAPQPVSQPGSC